MASPLPSLIFVTVFLTETSFTILFFHSKYFRFTKLSIHALNRYPRWGDAGDGTTSASANSKSPPPSVPTVTAAAESLADESHGFERTASSSSSSSSSSRSVGHLENVSNLSPSVQKLLREFATDSDDLTGSDSASMLRSSSLPSPSKDQELGHHVDDQIRVATEENVLVSPPDANQPADTDTAVTSQLAAITTSTADTLADVTQVLGCCLLTKHYP